MAERGNLSGEGLVLPVFGRSALVSDRLFMAGLGRWMCFGARRVAEGRRYEGVASQSN